jgi:tRNA threonylcarbamoyladenosine biosynthesis protein TsaB
MPSLREVLAAHAPLLVLDAASSCIHVGWIEAPSRGDPGGGSRWETSGDEAGVAVFACLERLVTHPNDAAALAFCDGPGSVLGIRTTAMALRVWQVMKPRPLFAYCSLALVAHALGRADISVIADARRDSWHQYQIGTGLRRAGAAELTGDLVMPEPFRHWAPLPPGVTRVGYDVADLLPRTADAGLFRETDAPDAFLYEEPGYAKWTPQIHRAPGER